MVGCLMCCMFVIEAAADIRCVLMIVDDKCENSSLR